MALEDVLNGFMASEATAAVAQRKSQIQGLYQGLAYLGEDPEQWYGIENNAGQLHEVASGIAPLIKKKALEDTKRNINAVLGTFDGDALVGLAIGLSPDAKELQLYSKAIQAGDYEAMRKLLVVKDDEGKPNKDSLFNKLYLPTANPDQLSQVIAARQKGLQSEFMIANLSKSEGKGDDAKYSFDKGKAVSYVADAAGKVGDLAYTAIGSQYVTNVTEAAQSRNTQAA